MSEALRSVFNVIERSSGNYDTNRNEDRFLNIPGSENEERNSFEGFKKK